MNICKRTMLYLVRKKRKVILLFLIFFLISILLLTCFSILDGTSQAARDLRSNIGAAFYIRPYTQMTFENATISKGETPVISQQSIDNIINIINKELKAYNTEHYGYAKSSQLHFLPGNGDNEASNMGRVTAVRDSKLTDVFLNEEYTLTAGRHIQPEDKNKILISTQLAAENHLQVGDIISVTHADLDQQDGNYIDTIPEKTAFAEVEIVGIFECNNATDSPDSPTAGKTVNHIISDNQLLVNLQEQQEGIYEGEIAFYIADPLKLDALLENVKTIDTINWDNHILRQNDFQYKQIASQLKNLQNLALALIIIASVLSIIILIMILLIRIRERMHEAGIYMSLGKIKAEIIGQFVLENEILLLFGFLLAFLLSVLCSGMLNRLLFGVLIQETGIPALKIDGVQVNYLKPDIFRFSVLFIGQLVAVLLSVLITSVTILRLKPKEILTKIS